MAFTVCFLVMAALAAPALGYSAGAPADACADMVPQHGTPPQTSVAPYTLSMDRKAIRSGDEVRLTISGKNAGDKIRGFLIQARQGDTPVGHFKVSPEDKFVQVVNCGNGKANAVTHKKHDEKSDKRSFRVTWVAPKDLKKDIEFRATIALNGGTFWVGVVSEKVKIH